MDKKHPGTTLKPCTWLAVLLLLSTLLAHATDSPGISGDDELLDPDEAFAISTAVNGNAVQVTWTIAPGYYLYRDRIRFSTDTTGIELGDATLPAGTIKEDEFFGKLAIFRNSVTATLPVKRQAGTPDNFVLKAVSQGCADIGVCYPPHTQTASLTLASAAGTPAATTQPALSSLDSLGGKLGLLSPDDEFLDADKAFQVDVYEEAPDLLRLHWVIAKGYYLYRDKLSIALADSPGIALGTIDIPPGETKHDEFFGDVQVFHDEIIARVALARSTRDAADITLAVGYQGCAEAGICYPPIKKQLPVSTGSAGRRDTARCRRTTGRESARHPRDAQPGPICKGAARERPGLDHAVFLRRRRAAGVYRLHVPDDPDHIQHHRRARAALSPRPGRSCCHWSTSRRWRHLRRHRRDLRAARRRGAGFFPESVDSQPVCADLRAAGAVHVRLFQHADCPPPAGESSAKPATA